MGDNILVLKIILFHLKVVKEEGEINLGGF